MFVAKIPRVSWILIIGVLVKQEVLTLRLLLVQFK